MRTVLLAHRYLGIAAGSLMVMWCLSGIVMMYVPYPRLAEGRRLSGLPPLSWNGCCTFGRNVWPNGGLDDFQIEMLGSRPVLRGEIGRPLDLMTGTAIEHVSAAQAAEVARSFAAGAAVHIDTPGLEPRLLGIVKDDTWTVAGVRAAERPLYRFAIDDGAGTELYVSSVSGRAVQATSARQRFWSWLGAIPHWLYFVWLRRHLRLWSAVVVYASMAGCLLAMSGIVVGWGQLRLARRGGSRYRGVRLWHHVAGLFFGIFTLTWVVSGLLSMNPWGLFESGGTRIERRRLGGAPLAAERVMVAVETMAIAATASGVVSLAAAPLGGKLFFLAVTAAGDRLRLDEAGHSAPLTSTDVAQAATELASGIPVASVDRMTKEDAYFFSHGADTARLPVYRVVLGDESNTRLYLDPVTAGIEAKVDRNAKGYRWLHQGLHRFDVLPAMRRRPTWDVLMIALLTGVLVVCVTGMCLGLRRLTFRGTTRADPTL